MYFSNFVTALDSWESLSWRARRWYSWQLSTWALLVQQSIVRWILRLLCQRGRCRLSDRDRVLICTWRRTSKVCDFFLQTAALSGTTSFILSATLLLLIGRIKWSGIRCRMTDLSLHLWLVWRLMSPIVVILCNHRVVGQRLEHLSIIAIMMWVWRDRFCFDVIMWGIGGIVTFYVVFSVVITTNSQTFISIWDVLSILRQRHSRHLVLWQRGRCSTGLSGILWKWVRHRTLLLFWFLS